MQFEGKYSDHEKQELEKLFKEMYYIKETDEWITSAHDWDEDEAINFIRQKAIRKANQVIEELTGEKPQDDTYVGFDCPACGNLCGWPARGVCVWHALGSRESDALDKIGMRLGRGRPPVVVESI